MNARYLQATRVRSSWYLTPRKVAKGFVRTTEASIGLTWSHRSTYLFLTALQLKDCRSGPSQREFKHGRSCTDQIFTVHRVLEQRFKFRNLTITCFIELRAAFVSVNRKSLWELSESGETPAKLPRLVRIYYFSITTWVRTYEVSRSRYSFWSGAGCVLFLFCSVVPSRPL